MMSRLEGGRAGVAKMAWLLKSVLALFILVPKAQSAMCPVEWCYHLPTCNYTTWPRIVPAFCSGTRQSPINIKTSEATENPHLKPFTFDGFNRKDVLTKLENTGRTIKVTIASGVGVSGGGLGERYDSLQFHLHWGNGTRVPGSEHTLNGKQFPMELHIVNIKSSLNGDTDEAVRDPAGLTALGFFIEALPKPASEMPTSWKLLTCYLSHVRWEGQSVDIKQPISLNSLLGGVSLTNYFRYNGSLTTPDCNEAVVWTVFKDPIKISADLINLFSTTVHIGSCPSPLMVNVFRGVQRPLPVQRSPACSHPMCHGYK